MVVSESIHSAQHTLTYHAGTVPPGTGALADSGVAKVWART